MRQPVLAVICAAMLCACTAQTSDTAAPAPSATPAPVTTPPAQPAQAAPQPAAAAPAKEIPEGECGDQSKVPAAQRIANTARWTTASEQNNFGFDVYRGDTEKGEFKKLTAEPILGAGSSDETHKYEYRDDTIDPCREYWYYVEGITTNGTREKFTPTFRAPPKRRAAGSTPMTKPASAGD